MRQKYFDKKERDKKERYFTDIPDIQARKYLTTTSTYLVIILPKFSYQGQEKNLQ